jgi:hypothetical protein
MALMGEGSISLPHRFACACASAPAPGPQGPNPPSKRQRLSQANPSSRQIAKVDPWDLWLSHPIPSHPIQQHPHCRPIKALEFS